MMKPLDHPATQESSAAFNAAGTTPTVSRGQSSTALETGATAPWEDERFAALADDLEMEEAQARAFLEALWSIMATFVDIGWGVDSVSILFPEIFDKNSNDETNMIASEETRTKVIDDA